MLRITALTEERSVKENKGVKIETICRAPLQEKRSTCSAWRDTYSRDDPRIDEDSML